MKILWLCNVVIPQVCNKINVQPSTGGGWMTQLAGFLDETDEVELFVCAPIPTDDDYLKVEWGNNSIFYGFKEYRIPAHIYVKEREETFKRILKDVKPDIVHIFGTEFPQTLAMVRAFANPEKTVIHIQGLVSIYSKHYEAFLPMDICKAYTFRDFIRKDNILYQKRKFEIRGDFEIEALQHVNHVIGRTDWDYNCAKLINPYIDYHYLQEVLRKEFYDGAWSYDNCEKHTILVSQGTYPIKGLHLALETLTFIKEKYPDVKLIVCGDNILQTKSHFNRLREGYYSKYIKMLLKKYDLNNNVFFTGPLGAEEMKEQMLKTNVFLLPSVIENSPNSMGEAMLLGVPSVVSYVGGVMSLAEHGDDVFFYQADAPYMAAGYIEKLFESVNECNRLSINAINKAKKQYCYEKIHGDLLRIYRGLYSI